MCAPTLTGRIRGSIDTIGDGIGQTLDVKNGSDGLRAWKLGLTQPTIDTPAPPANNRGAISHEEAT